MQVAIAFAAVPDKAEDDVERLFRATTIGVQRRIGTVVYGVVDHVVIDQIGTTIFGKTIDQHFDHCFKAYKAAEVFGKRLIRNHELLTQLASFVQTKTIDIIANQGGVYVFGSKARAASAKKDVEVTAEKVSCMRHRLE